MWLCKLVKWHVFRFTNATEIKAREFFHRKEFLDEFWRKTLRNAETSSFQVSVKQNIFYFKNCIRFGYKTKRTQFSKIVQNSWFFGGYLIENFKNRSQYRFFTEDPITENVQKNTSDGSRNHVIAWGGKVVWHLR